MNRKGTERLAEIRDGGRRRLSRFDFAVLAGQLYRQPDGNSVPLRDICDQRYGVIPDRAGLRLIDDKNALERKLAIPDPNRLHRGLHDIL